MPEKPEVITRLLDAVYPSFALLAGMELDLFSALAGSAKTDEHLAKILDVQVTKLRALLNVLVVAGLLSAEDNMFSNTAEADTYLVKGKADYLGGIWELTSSNWANALQTAQTIRTGKPPELYDYHTAPPEELTGLFRGLYPGAISTAKRLMEHFDFSSYRSLLDAGGGSGALAITLAQANPHLKATVLDLPLVTPITQQFIDEAAMQNQVETMTANVVEGPLHGEFDVVVARHIIQVLSIEDSRALLKNLATVVKPGGEIYLIGWILDDSRRAPQKTVFYNLILLNGYDDGQAYTESEYRAWLLEAGFEPLERLTFSDGGSIMTARKPA